MALWPFVAVILASLAGYIAEDMARIVFFVLGNAYRVAGERGGNTSGKCTHDRFVPYKGRLWKR